MSQGVMVPSGLDDTLPAHRDIAPDEAGAADARVALVDPEAWHLSLATMPGSAQARQVAIAVVALSALFFVVALPFSRQPLLRIPAFIASYEAALTLCNFITAVLLFGQFRRTRSLAFLVLAAGYLFVAIIIVLHALTFPAVFAPDGLLGGDPQTTAWLYVSWHAGFPLCVLAYTLIAGTRFDALDEKANLAVVIAVAIVLAGACGVAALAMSGLDFLPVIISNEDHSLLIRTGVGPTMWGLTWLALIVLWRRHSNSLLDLWLMVSLAVWLLDVALSALVETTRYDLGWYAGRTYGMLAASFVLAVMLFETSELHNRLLGAKALLEEHARTLEGRVRARTAQIRRTNEVLKAEIVERKRGETSTTLLAAIVASSDDAIMSKTIDGIITSWNAGAERLFGYGADEAIGRHISLIIPPERLGEEEESAVRILERKPIDHFETVRITKGGRRIDISASVSPLLDSDGNLIGDAKVIRDITARKRQEAEIARHVEALERSNRELDDFAYIASHDLKEPLRGLFNNAKFLLEDYSEKLDHEGVRRLQRLGYLSQRMEQLINNLLYFSRLGRQELAIKRTDLEAVIRDIEMMSETALKEQNARIIIPHPLPSISCDEIRITEVFRNLISNAAKYNKNDIRIIEVGFIPSMKTDHGIEKEVFYVRDNGIGIDKEFHEDIFRIFKRLNVEDDDKKGTGVGLTFVRKIVERHGGRIWLDSKPGAGTTFYFTIEQGAVHEAAA